MLTRFIALLLPLLMCGACASTGGGSEAPPPAKYKDESNDDYARRLIGDVRIFWYLKPFEGLGTGADPRHIVQKLQRRIWINKGHSLYIGIPDHQLKDEEFLISSVDMYDILLVMKRQFGFFDRGAAVNIGTADPIEYSDQHDRINRIIAVEQIKGGKVNVSLFARFNDETDAERMKQFNRIQKLLMSISTSLNMRGSAGIGDGPDIRQPEHRRR